MKFLSALFLLTPLLTSAAPADALSSLPSLSGFNGRPGMTFVDPDGVYRAYLPDGTVIDAARLTRAQIAAFVAARAPHLSTPEAAAEAALYADIDSSTVPESALLAPSEATKPQTLLAAMAAHQSRRDANPLLEARAKCGNGCVNTPYVCSKGCVCNPVNCRKIP